MKTVVRERTITKQIPVEVTESYIEYVANDGKVFDTEDECIRHENKAVEDEIFKKIKKADWHDLPLCLELDNAGRFSDDDRFYWYCPTVYSEIEAINAHYNLNDEDELSEEDIYRWVCIDEYGDDVYVYKDALSDIVRYVNLMFRVFGYETDIKFVGDEEK